MKALVTGGAGFIGSHIVDRLLFDGHDVVVIDNESTDCHESFNWNDNAENYKYDIYDYDKIEPLFKNVDRVFHLAAEARIQPAIQNPTLTTKTNVYGTCNVLQASRQNNVGRVMFSSTSASYGLKNKAPVREDMVPDCLNAYSITKVAGENLCKMFYDLHGLETVCFRYFNVYGERQPVKGQYAPVIGLFQRQHETGNPMTIVGDGKQRRDFTYVGDVVEANMIASMSKSKDILGEVFNIGTGQNHSMWDLVKMISKETTLVENKHYRFIPERPAEVKISLADITKADKVLKWQPFMNLREWLNTVKV
mgnify:CR=1 FL=1